MWKKLRDSKIRTKLMVYIVLVAIICSSVIGGISYVTMRDSLTDTAKDSATSLMKQVGNRVEERIREFQDTSYSFISRPAVYGLINDGEDAMIGAWKYTQNQVILTGEFLSSTVLHNYSDFLILESNRENIYYYDQRAKASRLNKKDAEEIMDALRDRVTGTAPAKWVKYGGRVYFVRRIVDQSDTGLNAMGTMVMAVSEDFFSLEEDENPYFGNKNLIVAGKDEIYKNNFLNLKMEDLEKYLSYKDGKYYIYTIMRETDGEKYLVIPMRTVRFQWNIMCFIPYSYIVEKANQVIPKVLSTTVILLSCGFLLGFLLYRNLRKNLSIIEQGIQQYESGNYSRLLSPAAYDEIGLLILQFNHMGMKIHELNELTRKEEEEKQELQYQVMEAQINPHFLYNTLGSLKWLAYEKEQEEIAKLADAIINLLRFTVKNANCSILFKEELAYIQSYIYIQQARYEDAFQVETQVTQEAENFTIIGFILQPFIENSILHGIDTARKDGRIRIMGWVEKEKLYITIQDNGKGMSEEKLRELEHKIQKNKAEKYRGFNGIGMTNIILRLKMVYGSHFCFKIDSVPQQGTSITLVIPGRKWEDEEKGIDC
ncbi:MAG: histidine kinase [Eubacteriales bacterium]|nr:histidine kinase [Eubacteriales bacterium]